MLSPSRVRSSIGSEAGFALIVAIIALMLLTFLGLTLMLTTTTETQVARNYTWSREAYYNALAGLEVAQSAMQPAFAAGKTLSQFTWLVPRTGTSMNAPPAATGSSATADTTGYIPGNTGRNWEAAACDTPTTTYGMSGVGYGRILTPFGGGAPLENITTYGGQTLNGAFTVWVRAPTTWNNTLGQMVDDNSPTAPSNPNRVVVTVEGTAPYSNISNTSDNLLRQNQAVQMMEVEMTSSSLVSGVICDYGQTGGGGGGAGFAGCSALGPTGIQGTQDSAAAQALVGVQ
jgi:Tfp pilus assembly protein PilX